MNALGRVTVGDGPHFWAAPFEIGAEFGGLGSPATPPPGAFAWPVKPMPGANTTIAVVATDARLTKAEARRLAVMAQDGPRPGDRARPHAPRRRPGLCRRHRPVPLADPVADLARLGDAAARVLARAVALGVYHASALPVAGAQAAWRDRFGGEAAAVSD